MSAFSSNAVIVDIVTTCVLHHFNHTKWYIIGIETTNNEKNRTFFSYYSLDATIDHFWQVLGLLFVEQIVEQKDTIGSRYCIFCITRYISLTYFTINIGGAFISTYSTAVFTVLLLLAPCSSQCSVHFCTGEKGQCETLGPVSAI